MRPGAVCALHKAGAQRPMQSMGRPGDPTQHLPPLLPLASSAGCRWLCFPFAFPVPLCEKNSRTLAWSYARWPCGQQTVCGSDCIPGSRTSKSISRSQANLFATGLCSCPFVPKGLSLSPQCSAREATASPFGEKPPLTELPGRWEVRRRGETLGGATRLLGLSRSLPGRPHP